MIKIQLILSTLFFTCMSLWSQTHLRSDFKDYTFEVFPLGSIEKLDVRAKHAQINMLNWDSDSISIETIIEISSDKPNLSKEMLDEISIKTATYNNTLQVKTTLAKDFSRTIPYKITYNIFYPKKIAIRVENNHGSVHIAQVQGGVFADISYCDINFKNFTQSNDSINNHINLLHCKGKINHLGSGNIYIETSTIDILTAKNINATTLYSMLNFDTASSYNGTSKVDNLKIGSSDSISLRANHSFVGVNHFGNYGLFECEQGTLNIVHAGLNFQQLIVNNHQTPTQIQLNTSTAYTINGEIVNGKFIHPKADKLEVIKDKTNISISGEIGLNTSTNTKVIIFNRDANIEFK